MGSENAETGEQPGRAEAKSRSDQRAKVADNLVAEARSRVTAANRTLLALFLLILWSWASNLSWIDFTGGKTGTYSERIMGVDDAKSTLTTSCLARVGRPPVRRPGSSDTIKADCDGKFQGLKDQFAKLNSDFDLFLIKLPDVHLKYHPLLLLILLSFTFSYALWSRYKILGFLSEAVRIYRKEVKWKAHDSGVLLPTIPFWLWPITSQSRSGLSARESIEYLALSPADRTRPILINGATIMLLFVTIHTFYVQSVLSSTVLGYPPAVLKRSFEPAYLNTQQWKALEHYYSSLSYSGSKLGDILVLGLVLAPAFYFLVISEGVSFRSLLRSRRSKRAATDVASLSRRNVVLAALTVAGIGIAIPSGRWNASAWFARLLRRAPRFRVGDTSTPVSLSPGLYWRARRYSSSAGPGPAAPSPTAANPPAGAENGSGTGSGGDRAPAGRIYHFVRMNRTIGGILQPIDLEDFRRQPARSRPVPAEEIAAASRFPVVERQALAFLLQGSSRAALDQLWPAIDPPDTRAKDPARCIRLYDLVAGIALRYGHQADLQRLDRLVEAYLRRPQDGATQKTKRAARQLARRRRAWRSPESKWRGLWLAPDKQWRRIDLPAPVKESEAAGRVLT